MISQDISVVWCIVTGPFSFTRAIASARVATRANQSARAVCRTPESSSSRLLGLLTYEVKPTIALTLLQLENSASTIDEFSNSCLVRFSVLG